MDCIYLHTQWREHAHMHTCTNTHLHACRLHLHTCACTAAHTCIPAHTCMHGSQATSTYIRSPELLYGHNFAKSTYIKCHMRGRGLDRRRLNNNFFVLCAGTILKVSRSPKTAYGEGEAWLSNGTGLMTGRLNFYTINLQSYMYSLIAKRARHGCQAAPT